VTELAGQGTDTVETSLASYALGANLERLTGLSALGQVLAGNALNNLISGGAGNDTLTGGDGDDTLSGGDSGDRLTGGAGADLLEGGAGNDTYVIEDALDTIAEQAGGGIDTVESALAVYTLDANLENLVLLTGASNGIGNGLDNVLTGNAAANELVGRDGNDTLFGNEGNDVLRGQGGEDLLRGGAGTDDLFGGAENDTLYGDHGNDRLYGNDGDDFGNGGNGDDNVFGGAGDDRLYGGVGNDTLNGQSGNDFIVGGIGIDLLVGGTGADRFVFLDGDFGPDLSATDRIKDFSSAQGDLIDLTQVDADTTLAGNQAFAWIGNAAFSGTAGELRYAIAGNTTTITGDTDGDGTADFALWLTGQVGLVAGDFVL
jgi:Ca2+-binding RTX toxin-like protein